MRLKRIDINGFKSFADKVSIDLSDGITAIVGPNGSGKSNIADAVRWVLGEQNARALRGNKMEDVIFDGSEKRKKQSFCEVVLTFDNADGKLALEASEVAITRRVFRSGDSEYLVNNQTCRMKDIAALLYDTGIGREGYSIIGQGKIEQILSPRGEERREAFEDAAGVMKFKVRREEARRKLNTVANDITRLTDIVTEIETNLEPLREQSELAKEFVELRERLKQLEVHIFLEQYDRNRDRLQTLQQTEQELLQKDEAMATREKELRAEEELAQSKLDLTAALLDKAHEKQIDLTTETSRLQSELDLTSQRVAFQTGELARLQEEKEQAEQRLKEIAAVLANAKENPREALELLRSEIDTLEEELRQLLDRALLEEEGLDTARQQWMDAMTSKSEREARAARMETLHAQGQMRLEQMRGEEAAALEELAQLTEELDAARSAEQKTAADLRRADEQKDQLAKKLGLANETVRSLRSKLQREQTAHQAALQRLHMQEELKKSYEGYPNSVKNLMRDVRANAQYSRGVFGVVGELLQVPAKLEKAVEQALGAGVQNVVVDTEQTAKQLIQYLRRQNYGRVTFLPLAALRVRTFNRQEKEALAGSGVIGCACDLLGFDASVRPAMEYLLGRTLIVEDMDSGIAVCKKCTFSFRCVTLLGDIINAGGAMTGGSTTERGLVSRDRLIADAKAAVQQLRSEAQTTEKQLEQAQDEEIALAAKLDELQKLAYALQSEAAVHKERLEATGYQQERAAQRAAQISEEIRQMESTLQMTLASMQTEEADVDEETLKQEIDTRSAALSQLRAEITKLSDHVNGKKLTFAAMESETSAMEANAQMLQRDRARVEQENTRRERDMERIGAELQTLRETLDRLQGEASSAETRLQENQSALSKLETEREGLQAKLRAWAFEREALGADKAEGVERRYRVQAQMERLQAEFENIQNRMWDDYGLSYEGAAAMRIAVKYGEAVREAESIRAKIREMEYVNPASIEEYERVSERYRYLTAQRDDLEKAKGDLETMIADLTAEMEKQFMEKFALINENFTAIFTQLFQGGHAELVLQDPEHAMECGIEIVAMPPGKTHKMISLLSGGERALTAFAILLAMQQLKATPFCIMDEIETALDDLNLRLFADYIKRYSDNTQFIVITHRRYTMEVADVLYGIAMEEKGVSKMVGVRMQDVV